MVHISRTKIFPDTLFSQNDRPEQYLKKTFPEKSNDIFNFREIKNVYWGTVPIVQVDQDAGNFTFIL